MNTEHNKKSYTGEISGAYLVGLIRSFNNIKLIDEELLPFDINTIQPDEWYPYDYLMHTISVVENISLGSDSILFWAGVKFIEAWYKQGPGKEMIFSSLDWVIVNEHGEGYSSVVKGSPSDIGWTRNLETNIEEGYALIENVMPLGSEYLRGIYYGGFLLFDDLSYFNAEIYDELNDPELPHPKTIIKLTFSPRKEKLTEEKLDDILLNKNSESLSQSEIEELVLYYKHTSNFSKLREKYNSDINNILSNSFYELKNIQQEQIESNEKLIAFYDLSPLGLALTDMDGNFLNFNKAFEKICGYTKEELQEIDFWKLTPKKYMEEEQKQLDSIAKKNAYGPYEKEYIQKNGNLIPINLNGIVISNSKGEKFVWSVVEDISERKSKDTLLYQQSKLAAMGEMLGNIAHQWRQPLSTISTAATGIKLQKEMDYLTDGQLNSALDLINHTSQYLSQTIEDFRTFLDPSNNKKSKFLITNIIKKTLILVSSQFKLKDIKIIERVENISIFSIENELIQVLINILNNSLDALVDIEKERFILINSYQKEKKLIIEIKDNAKGIPEDIIDRVFEPYFTTKHKSQGTGIGLYMCQEITTKHLNGNIEVENETYIYENIEYTGAKFTIKIDIV